MHDVAVADDVHELADVYGSGRADLRQVVAGEVNEHEVLCSLLLIGQEFPSQGVISFRCGTAGARTGDRVRDHLSGPDGDERFRARSR